MSLILNITSLRPTEDCTRSSTDSDIRAGCPLRTSCCRHPFAMATSRRTVGPPRSLLFEVPSASRAVVASSLLVSVKGGVLRRGPIGPGLKPLVFGTSNHLQACRCCSHCMGEEAQYSVLGTGAVGSGVSGNGVTVTMLCADSFSV